VEQGIQFHTPLIFEGQGTSDSEIWTQMVLNITERDGVVKREWERLVVSESGGKLSIVLIDIGWTPIVRGCGVEALALSALYTPNSLIGHPIQKVVSTTRDG
jgi:hypothetical protein